MAIYEPGSANDKSDGVEQYETLALNSYENLVKAINDGINGHSGKPYQITVNRSDGSDHTVILGQEKLSDDDLKTAQQAIIDAFDDVESLTEAQKANLTALQTSMQSAEDLTVESLQDEIDALTPDAPAPPQAQTQTAASFDVDVNGQDFVIYPEEGKPAFTEEQKGAIADYMETMLTAQPHERLMASSGATLGNGVPSFDISVPGGERRENIAELAKEDSKKLDHHIAGALQQAAESHSQMQNPGMQMLMFLVTLLGGGRDNETERQAEQVVTIESELARRAADGELIAVESLGVDGPKMEIAQILKYEDIYTNPNDPTTKLTQGQRAELLETLIEREMGAEGVNPIAVTTMLSEIKAGLNTPNNETLIQDAAIIDAVSDRIDELMVEPRRDAMTLSAGLQTEIDGNKAAYTWETADGKNFSLEIDKDAYEALTTAQQERLGEIAVSLSMPNKPDAQIDDIAAMLADENLPRDLEVKYRNPGMRNNDIEGTLEDVIRGFDDKSDSKGLSDRQLGDNTERLANTAATGNDPTVKWHSETAVSAVMGDALKSDLMQTGHLDASVKDTGLAASIAAFQEEVGLNVDGKPNDETLAMLDAQLAGASRSMDVLLDEKAVPLEVAIQQQLDEPELPKIDFDLNGDTIIQDNEKGVVTQQVADATSSLQQFGQEIGVTEQVDAQISAILGEIGLAFGNSNATETDQVGMASSAMSSDARGKATMELG